MRGYVSSWMVCLGFEVNQSGVRFARGRTGSHSHLVVTQSGVDAHSRSRTVVCLQSIPLQSRDLARLGSVHTALSIGSRWGRCLRRLRRPQCAIHRFRVLQAGLAWSSVLALLVYVYGLRLHLHLGKSSVLYLESSSTTSDLSCAP